MNSGVLTSRSPVKLKLASGKKPLIRLSNCGRTPNQCMSIPAVLGGRTAKRLRTACCDAHSTSEMGHIFAPNTARVLQRRMSVAPRKRQSATKMRPVVKGQQATSACHSITSSAVASSVGGIVNPSAFAVLRFTTVSYLVGACTCKSTGFAPRRMRST